MIQSDRQVVEGGSGTAEVHKLGGGIPGEGCSQRFVDDSNVAGVQAPVARPNRKAKSASRHSRLTRATSSACAAMEAALERCRLSSTASTTGRARRRNSPSTCHFMQTCARAHGQNAASLRAHRVSRSCTVAVHASANKDVLQQMSSSPSSLPWSIGGVLGIESVLHHVNLVNDRVLWGMVALEAKLSDGMVEGNKRAEITHNDAPSAYCIDVSAQELRPSFCLLVS